VRLDRRVRRAVERVVALDHQLRGRELGVHVAERELHVLADVALLAALVDRRVVAREALARVVVGVQQLVLDADQLERRVGRVLVERRDRGDGIADEAHLVDRERVLVLRPGDHAVLDRQVAPADHRVHARQRQRSRGVDAPDPGVRVRAAQRLRVQHARQGDVVGVDGGTRGLVQRVDLAVRLADDVELAPGRSDAVLVARAHQRASQARGAGATPSESAIASSTASKICV
jgi:hypothetical protein